MAHCQWIVVYLVMIKIILMRMILQIVIRQKLSERPHLQGWIELNELMQQR